MGCPPRHGNSQAYGFGREEGYWPGYNFLAHVDMAIELWSTEFGTELALGFNKKGGWGDGITFPQQHLLSHFPSPFNKPCNDLTLLATGEVCSLWSTHTEFIFPAFWVRAQAKTIALCKIPYTELLSSLLLSCA